MNMRLFCNSFADCCRLAKIHWTLMNKIKGPQLFSLYATHVWEEFDINLITHSPTNSHHKFTLTAKTGWGWSMGLMFYHLSRWTSDFKSGSAAVSRLLLPMTIKLDSLITFIMSVSKGHETAAWHRIRFETWQKKCIFKELFLLNNVKGLCLDHLCTLTLCFWSVKWDDV